MPSLLDVADLETAYGPVRALAGVSLAVEEGEIVCVIGPNGAGKTTLMKTIAGLLVPSAGTIRFAGDSIAGRRTHRTVALGVSLVPEGRRVFAPLSVRDNLTLGAYLRLRAGKAAEVDTDMDRVYSIFPRLKERAAQSAGTLSGGEQQMLAIGRAMMARPRLLLLDEPSMGLAPLVIAEIFRVIARLHEQGTTVLFAEQNARMALAVAQRGYVLESGRLAMSGPAAALAADDRVRASYLGGA